MQARDEGMMLYGPIPQTRQRNVNILMNKKHLESHLMQLMTSNLLVN